MFLIGHYHYFTLTKDEELMNSQKENIKEAVEYIKSHLMDFVFYENPKHCGNNKFALKVTYWKDSELLKRKNGSPEYPVAYTLAHIINLCAIRCASKLLNNDKNLNEISLKMKERISQFYDHDNHSFYIAIDSLGPVSGVSSDMLHSLFYLDKNDLSNQQLQSIITNSKQLETR